MQDRSFQQLPHPRFFCRFRCHRGSFEIPFEARVRRVCTAAAAPNLGFSVFRISATYWPENAVFREWREIRESPYEVSLYEGARWRARSEEEDEAGAILAPTAAERGGWGWWSRICSGKRGEQKHCLRNARSMWIHTSTDGPVSRDERLFSVS